MKNASSITPRGWRHNFVILAIASLIVLGTLFGLALPCGGKLSPPEPVPKEGFRPSQAGVGLQAQPSGHLVIKSSDQVVDTVGNPWQITVYKYPQTLDPQPLMLGLKGTQAHSISPETPLQIRLHTGQTISAPAHPLHPSLDWAADTFDAQYNLSTVWPTLDQAKAITLILPTETSRSTQILVSPQTLQEWHTVASCKALLCTSL
jgi:hypothetical protein